MDLHILRGFSMSCVMNILSSRNYKRLIFLQSNSIEEISNSNKHGCLTCSAFHGKYTFHDKEL